MPIIHDFQIDREPFGYNVECLIHRMGAQDLTESGVEDWIETHRTEMEEAERAEMQETED